MAKEFLGRGWKFPVGINPVTGRLAMSEHEQDIKESIRIIVTTAPGERLMRPDFGCGINELVFSAINRVTLGMFESRIRQAIIKWGPRVEILKLEIGTAEVDRGKLDIQLTCRVRETNNEFNLVFPFYLTEGTG